MCYSFLDSSSETEQSEESEQPVKSRLKDLGRTRRSIRIASSASKAEQEQKLMALRGADRAASLPTDRKGGQYNAEGKARRSTDVSPILFFYNFIFCNNLLTTLVYF